MGGDCFKIAPSGIETCYFVKVLVLETYLFSIGLQFLVPI